MAKTAERPRGGGPVQAEGRPEGFARSEEARNDRRFSISGREVKLVYDPADLEGLAYERDLGAPGSYPFTRGVHATMYRGKLWTMRMFAGFGTAEDTNARFHYLLQQGQTGLSTAFDLPTLMGLDSDHPHSRGEVGREGVAIDTLADMETLFQGIPLDQVTTSMTISSPAPMILAMYLAVAEKQGVPWSKLAGTTQTDILKEYIAQKEFIYPPRPSMRLITDMFAFCSRQVPRWNTISVSGYHIREAGATAGQELAFTLADGFAYVEAGIAAGLDVDDFAPRISFFFDVHSDFFEEIAKFRAARRIWAREMRLKYKAKNPRSWMLRAHAQTAGVSLTAQQPENNIVRTAIQALAAVLAGAQSLHTNSMDEALSLPTEQAVKIALRTQQIIAEETGVASVADPLGGSYYVEALTNALEAEAYEYFRRIEEAGGVIRAIEDGFFQREIAEASYRFQRRVEAGEYRIVGVNAYRDDRPLAVPLLKIDDVTERRQLARLEDVKRGRDPRRVRQALANLARAAQSDENTMPYLLDCARAYCTLGEMVDVLRPIFGEYQEPTIY